MSNGTRPGTGDWHLLGEAPILGVPAEAGGFPEAGEGTPGKIATACLAALIISLTMVEFIALWHTPAGRIGMMLWLAALGSMFMVSVRSLWNLVRHSIRSRRFFSLAAFGLMVGLVAYNVHSPVNATGEAPQQAACAIARWESSVDKGFHQPCFLGYPTRQYLALALPSMVFGPSPAALNWGGSLYFLLALPVWLWGVNRFLGGWKGDLLAALSVTLLLHFRHFNRDLLHSFEQSNFPLSLGLMLLGACLWYTVTRERWVLYSLGLALLFLAQSYTTALALFPLAIVLMIPVIRSDEGRGHALIILSGALTSVAVSFTFRHDLNLVGERNHHLVEGVQGVGHEVWAMLRYVFLENHGSGSFATTLGRAFVVLALLSPVILKRKRLFFGVFWIVFTSLAAVLSHGYSYNPIDFRTHRLTVVLPVILMLGMLVVNRTRVRQWVLVAALSVSALWGVRFCFAYISSTNSEQVAHVRLISLLEESFEMNAKHRLVFSHEANRKFVSSNDSLMYYLPHLERSLVDEPAQAWSVFTAGEGLILVLDSEDFCAELQERSPSAVFQADDQRLLLFD